MTTVEHITREELLMHLQNIHSSINGLADVQRAAIAQQSEQASKIAVLYERVDNMKDWRARVISTVAAIAALLSAAFSAR